MQWIIQQVKTTATFNLLVLLVSASLAFSSNADTKLKTYSVYLAGPEVFLSEPVKAGEEKKALIAALAEKHQWPFKLVGLYPLDNSIADFKNDFATGVRIYHANIALMQKADFILANMVRFRGPSMDVGTAFEMGYMAGLNKPVFAYYDAEPFYGQAETPLLLTERVAKYWNIDPADKTKDADGIHIEQFNMVDNLMMIGAHNDTGYPIALSFEDAILNIANHIQAQQ